MRSTPRLFQVIRKYRLSLAAGMVFGVGAGLVAGSSISDRQSLMAGEKTRRAVAAVKHAIVDGHKQRDHEALDRLYAEDFTAVDSQGIRTKADLLAGLATDPEIVEGTYELSAVRQWGDLAVAKGRGRMVIRSSDGTTRELEYESFNVFEQQDGRWVYAAAFLP